MPRAAHINKMISILGHRYFDPFDLEDEIWLPISMWKGFNLRQLYYVSNKGRIKNSENAVVPGSIDPQGYHCVQLQYRDLDNGRHSFVHSLVVNAFTGPPPETMISPTVQHKDHNKLNNSIQNLEWMEMSDNCRDAQAIKVRIIDRECDHLFSSKEEASIIYCKKAGGYINDCMSLSIPVTNDKGQIVSISCQAVNSDKWVDYIPTKDLKPWRISCIITDSSGMHNFKSIAAAARYLGQNDGYIQYHINHSIPIFNKITNEKVSFNMLNDLDKEVQ